jgi:hypothetical protein
MSDITNDSDNQLSLFHLFVVVLGVGWDGVGVKCVFCDAENTPELFNPLNAE